MDARRRTALIAGVCVLLVMSLLFAGCTRPKPVESPSPQATPTVALSPAATQPPVAQSTPASAETPVPTATAELPAPPQATPEPTAAPPQPEPTAEPGASTYTVQAGDTLYGLAVRFGTTAAEIAALNGISVDALLTVGQVLQVPGSASEPPNVHIVQAGENLYRIALRYGITWQELAQLNGIYDPTTLRVGQRLILPSGTTGTQPPPSSGRTHVVQPGDTLYGLAARYGVTAEAIAQANNLTLYSLLYVGQTLVIP